MDARIGQLNSGKFYTFANGYDQEPVTGTLEEVEVALGLREIAPVEIAAPVAAKIKRATYAVTMTFEFPAWDETKGVFFSVEANSKKEAIKEARRQAYADGYATTGKGKYWFKAEEAE